MKRIIVLNLLEALKINLMLPYGIVIRGVILSKYGLFSSLRHF